MRSLLLASLMAMAAALPLGLTGCGPTAPKKKVDDHAHDHDHDHSHAHGLHDGHIMELGEEEYHAEWAHDDASGKITVYILDKEMKKDVPIAAEKLTIKTSIKGEAGDTEETYELEGVDPVDGKTAQFEITNKPLLTILTSIGAGTAATLEVPIEGKTYVQKFEQDDHAGHKH